MTAAGIRGAANTSDRTTGGQAVSVCSAFPLSWPF